MRQGKDRGKRGKILFAFPAVNKVVVEGLNLTAHHQRAKKQGQKGQIVHKERAINASAAQIICPSCGKPSRVSHKILESKSAKGKVRICKKCGGEI